MRPPKGVPVYRLIRSQEMVAYMWRYTLHTQSTQIPCAMLFAERLDFDALTRALNIEIARNDCMRLRLTRTPLGIREFFLPEYRLPSVEQRVFTTKEEQEAVLNADAAKALDVFRGKTYRLMFFRAWDGRSGIYLKVSHMVMDAMASFLFFKDLLAVYDHLTKGTPLPRPLGSYEDIVRREQNNPELDARILEQTNKLRERVALDRRPFFCAPNGPKMIDRQAKLLHKPDLDMPFAYSPFRDHTHFLKLRLTHEDSEAITAFVKENRLSAEWVVQLGFRLFLSKINREVNDTMIWVLCPRRKTVAEKRCGGTLASPMPWREILHPDMTFRETLATLAASQLELFRLSDVPFTDVRDIEQKLYHLSIMQTPTSMMFSYLQLNEDAMDGRDFEYVGCDFAHYVMPLYTITMRDPRSGDYVFSYIHRLTHHTDDEIRRFHEGTVKAILAGVKNPDAPLADILKIL